MTKAVAARTKRKINYERRGYVAPKIDLRNLPAVRDPGPSSLGRFRQPQQLNGTPRPT